MLVVYEWYDGCGIISSNINLIASITGEGIAAADAANIATRAKRLRISSSHPRRDFAYNGNAALAIASKCPSSSIHIDGGGHDDEMKSKIVIYA